MSKFTLVSLIVLTLTLSFLFSIVTVEAGECKDRCEDVMLKKKMLAAQEYNTQVLERKGNCYGYSGARAIRDCFRRQAILGDPVAGLNKSGNRMDNLLIELEYHKCTRACN